MKEEMYNPLDEIEILEVDESPQKDFKDILNQESKTRQTMLRFTNEEMIDHTRKMVEYTQIKEEYKFLQEKYKELEQENKVNIFKQNQCEIELKLKDEENISLKQELEKTKKKLITVQSLLQVLVNTYGIDETIRIIGIPYIKLKEYLQE